MMNSILQKGLLLMILLIVYLKYEINFRQIDMRVYNFFHFDLNNNYKIFK